MKKRGLKIYFIHSGKIDYNNLIYLPVLRSEYLSNHTLIFATSLENQDKYFKSMIGDADILVIELSNPDIGLNMEIKEAIISKKPLLALCYGNEEIDSKYTKLFKNIFRYNKEDEIRSYVESFAKSYDGKINNGVVDNTIVLGTLE